MERMITSKLLTDLASNVLREVGRNECRLLSVSREPNDESLPDMGSATLDEIAPLWCVDFIWDGRKPLIVHIQDKPGVTDGVIRNELLARLRHYVESGA